MSEKKDILHDLAQKVSASFNLTDALAFCFFLLFSTGIWYIHTASKRHSANAQADSQPAIFQGSVNTEKRLRVPLVATGAPAGKVVLPFQDSITVTVRVSQADYESIRPDDIRAVCKYHSSSGNTLSVEASCSNQKATVIHVTPDEVEYVIQEK